MDDFAKSMFVALGYDEELPKHIKDAYHEFKKHKDRIQPGRLSAEGYATVAMLAEMKVAVTPAVDVNNLVKENNASAEEPKHTIEEDRAELDKVKVTGKQKVACSVEEEVVQPWKA